MNGQTRSRRGPPLALITAALLALLTAAACGDGTPPTEAPSTPAPSEATNASPTGQPTNEATATTGSSTPAATATTITATSDFATYYSDNCAVCHGPDRDGVGRTPALTPTALTDDIDDYLDETDDRTHRSIWTRTALTEDDRRALFAFLASTSP